MRIALFGATGRIGGHVLSWALDAGYPVSALARTPEPLLQGADRLDPFVRSTVSSREAGARAASGGAGREAVGTTAWNGTPHGPAGGLSVVRGDVLDKTAVAEVIAGADAVISALGPRGAKAPALLTAAASNIVGAMQQTGVRRLICVSAAGPFVSADPNMSWLVKQVLPRIFANTFADVRGMEDVIRESSLDWTLVRATMLVNGPGTGRYRVSPDYAPMGGRKIARADVAHFIAAVLTGNGWLRSAPALAY
jgi:putative NADH-flavin reductase